MIPVLVAIVPMGEYLSLSPSLRDPILGSPCGNFRLRVQIDAPSLYYLKLNLLSMFVYLSLTMYGLFEFEYYVGETF